LVTEPTESPDVATLQVSRTPVAEVYTQILSDLDFAKLNLPETHAGLGRTARATKPGFLNRTLAVGKQQLMTAPSEGFEEIIQNVLQQEGIYQSEQALQEQGITPRNPVSTEEDFVNRFFEFASTDKAYGELDDDEYLESSPLNGKFPYDASKVTTDILAKSYRHTYNMPIAVTRGCNIYGPGDNNTQRLIPGIAKAFLTNQEFVIRNGGRDIREYIHVDDVSEAYIKIAEHVEEKNLHAAFNISSGNRYSTIEVFNLMEKAIGKEINSKIIFEDAKEISKQLMNHDLLTSATGWEPKIKFEDGIKDVASWYLNNTI
jgi:hypothetical protein